MKINPKMGAVVGVSMMAMIATAADARHQWRKYAWAWDGTPIDVVIYNNTSGDWVNRVPTASTDWNVSDSINGSVSKGNNAQCDFITGRIDVCNDDYGSVGWLGLASIQINGNEITSGWSKMNDFYFNQPQYDTEIWRQLVMCQEIGHNYGLGHQNENFRTNTTDSCMEYTSTPTAIDMTPDAHDYEQLEQMYPTSGGGDDGGDTGGPPTCRGRGCNKGAGIGLGNTPDSWGEPVEFLPNGKPFVYERRLTNGTRIVTHVTWTIESGHGAGRPSPCWPAPSQRRAYLSGGDHDH